MPPHGNAARPLGSPAVSQVATFAAFGVAFVAQYLAARNWHDASGWILYAVAVVLIVSAARPVMVPHQAPRVEAPHSRLERTRGVGVVLGTAAVVAATVLSAYDRWPVLALALWLGGLVAVSLALLGRIVSPPKGAGTPWSRREVALVIAILIGAALARIAWLGSVPYYYFADESRVAMFLQETFARRIPNFFTMGWNTWAMLGLSWQGLFAPLVGLHIATLRASSALMGTLAVLATYLLARELYSPRVAVCAALLLAMCRTAIDFSRLGICHAQLMFLEPLALYLWVRSVNTGYAASYLGTGIVVGLCLYTYTAGQSVPVFWLLWIVLCALVIPRNIRAYWPGVAIALAGFLLAVLPYVLFVTDGLAFAHNWNEWTAMMRNRQVISQFMNAWTIHGPENAIASVRSQITRTWLGFHILPAGAYGLGYRGGGMLDHIAGALFVLGLAMAVSRWRQPPNGFLLYWWLLTAVTGSVLTANPPAFVRLVGVVPVIVILATLPLDLTLRVTAGVGPPRIAGLAWVVLLLVASGWENWRTYFVEFPRGEIDLASLLARQLEQQPCNTSAYLLGGEYAWRPRAWQTNQLYFNQELFLVNFRGQQLLDVSEPAHLLPLHQAATTPLILVLGPTQLTLAEYVRSLYPQAQFTEVGPRGLAFGVVELTPEDVERRAGLTVQRYDADGVETPTIADPFVTTPAEPDDEHWRVWKGSLYWPSDKPTMLHVRAGAPLELRIGDRSVMQPDGQQNVTIPLQLPRGWVPILLDERANAEHALTMEIGDGKHAVSVSRWDLRPEFTPEGLLAEYERDGAVFLHTLDSQLNSVADERIFEDSKAGLVQMPFAVTWRGALRVPQDGEYAFEVHATGPFTVTIDGQPLAQLAKARGADPAVARNSRYLTAGDHPIVARWDCTRCGNPFRRVFQMYWTPPGGDRRLIPPTNFVPTADPHTTSGSPGVADIVRPVQETVVEHEQ